MPLYRFHLHDDLFVEDEEGLELADLEAAREQALESARELVCAHIRQFGNVNLDHYIDVADESGAILFRITFRDAFTVSG
ncbi:DUF6894 family protein [Sphingosinicella terrae]|uniref:DUF6894 family protein n=1 Tax=Sphingosinicella terrae TaxID=2172047 RepID=UPI000E0DDA1D|nr:hypothetical protein [Sphingosinicella terrae]